MYAFSRSSYDACALEKEMRRNTLFKKLTIEDQRPSKIVAPVDLESTLRGQEHPLNKCNDPTPAPKSVSVFNPYINGILNNYTRLFKSCSNISEMMYARNADIPPEEDAIKSHITDISFIGSNSRALIKDYYERQQK